MLVPMKDILVKSQAGHYGVIAPNILNEDTARVAVEAATELHAPIIIDIGYLVHPDINMLVHITSEYARRAPVPVAINLDHGRKFEHAIGAIRAGYTSIMVDRSSLPFEENVAEVADIARIAHAVGIDVEAELGHVGDAQNYAHDGSTGLTDPDEAQEYIKRTGIDFLAVAIGTAHGVYKGTPHLDFDLLQKLRGLVDIPLVLHGGSGSGDDNLVRAIACGITKVNLATDLFAAGIASIDPEAPPHHIYYNVTAGYKAKLKYYIELFGQAGKA
nr:class II fructose-bisphosphate aldolase [Maliibacterium massiliense]